MSCLLHASEHTYAMIRISLYPAMMSYCSYFLKHALRSMWHKLNRARAVKTFSEDFDELIHRASAPAGIPAT